MFILFDKLSGQYVGFVSFQWRLVPTTDLAHQFESSGMAGFISGTFFKPPTYQIELEEIPLAPAT